VRGQHDAVVAYVNSVIGTSAQPLSAACAVVEDVPISTWSTTSRPTP